MNKEFDQHCAYCQSVRAQSPGSRALELSGSSDLSQLHDAEAGYLFHFLCLCLIQRMKMGQRCLSPTEILQRLSEQMCQRTPDDLISHHASVQWSVIEPSMWKVCYYGDQHKDDYIFKSTLLGMAGNACSSSYQLHVRLRLKLKGGFLKLRSLKLAQKMY